MMNDIMPGGLASRPRTLQRVNFTNANLQNAKFDHVVMDACVMADADARGAEFDGTFFGGSDLTNVDWEDASPAWPDSDSDQVREFMETFGNHGLTIPHIPYGAEIPLVHLAPRCFGTSGQPIPIDALASLERVADLLRAGNHAATFFIVGVQQEAKPTVWNYIAQEDHVAVLARMGTEGQAAAPLADDWDDLMCVTRHLLESSLQPSDPDGLMLMTLDRALRTVTWQDVDFAGLISRERSLNVEGEADLLGEVGSFVEAMLESITR